MPTQLSLIDAEKEHYFDVNQNSGPEHEIFKKNGVPTEYKVLGGIGHYAVYGGQPLDDVMKLEISWFDKYLKGKESPEFGILTSRTEGSSRKVASS